MQKSKDSSKACCENVNAFWTLVWQQRDNFQSRSAMFLISFRKLLIITIVLNISKIIMKSALRFFML